MALTIAGGVRPGKIIEIEHRLFQQLIVGKQKATAMVDEPDAALEDDAKKLTVEREALIERLTKQSEATEIFLAISNQLIDTVSNSIDHQLANHELVLQYSGVNEKQLLMLELLQKKNININRLASLIMDETWLARDLTNVVNSPLFRNRRPNRADIKVTDIKLVLNFIGIENIKLFIPYFCLRNWLPSGHAHLLWTTRKLWRYSIISAIAAKALAQLHDRDISLLYAVTLLNQLGPSVVLKNSAKLFEHTWGEWLREASSSREKEIYDAVMATDFPAEKIYQQVLNHGNHLNWQLLQRLSFSDSPMCKILKELDNNLCYSELTTDAALIARASCFAKVLLLEELRQISPQDKRAMFEYYELTEQELIRLKGLNYRKLEIV